MLFWALYDGHRTRVRRSSYGLYYGRSTRCVAAAIQQALGRNVFA